MIRLVIALRRKSGIDVEEFQEHLVRKYGPLMARYGDVLGIRKYVQSVTLDGDPDHAGWIESRGSEMEPSYDAVSEVWWDTLEKLSATVSSSEGKEAWAALLAEEKTVRLALEAVVAGSIWSDPQGEARTTIDEAKKCAE